MTDDLKARLLNEIGLSLEGTAMEAADRIEALEEALKDIIIYSSDDTAIKTARAALEGKDDG